METEGWFFSPSSDELGLAVVAPYFERLFGSSVSFVDAQLTTHPLSRLSESVVALYFSAHWSASLPISFKLWPYYCLQSSG